MATPLKVMRDEFKKFQWALYLVIAAFIILIFAVWGGGGGGGGGAVVSDAVVQVGNKAVSSADFYRMYRRQVDMYKQAYGDSFNEDLLKNFDIPGQVVNQIIDRQILAEQAARSGVSVSDRDVFDKIMTMDVFKNEQGAFIGKDRYVRILKASRMTTEGFESDIRTDLLIERYQQMLKQGSVVAAKEIREEFMKQKVQTTADYLYIQDSVFQGQVTLGTEEIAAFYEENRDTFFQPERRKVTYLLADVSKIKGSIVVDDKEIASYYEEHRDEFPQPEQVQARHILIKTDKRSDEEALALARTVRRKIVGGLDFVEAAKKYSEDPSNAKTGGNLGWFGRGRMVPPFEEAAFSMKEGVLSEPVKTTFGYHLIQKTGYKASGIKPLSEVEFNIRDKLSRGRAEKAAKLKIDGVYAGLASKETVTDDELRALADADDQLTFNTTDPFQNGVTVPGIGRNEEVMSAVYSDAIQEGNITPPIKIGRGYAIIRLEKILPEGVPPLEEIEDKVAQKARLAAAHEKGKERLLEMISRGSDLSDIARSLKLKVKEDQTIRYLSPIPILGNGKAMHKTLAEVESGVLTDPFEVNGGWALFIVKERTTFTEEEFAKERDAIRERMKDQWVSTCIRATIEEIKAKTKIRINQEYLDRLS